MVQDHNATLAIQLLTIFRRQLCPFEEVGSARKWQMYEVCILLEKFGLKQSMASLGTYIPCV